MKMSAFPMRTIGLDIHKETVYVTILDTGKDSPEQFELQQGRKLEAFLQGLGPQDRVALEAGRESYYYHKLLQSRVGEVMVANPRKLEMIAGSQAKNDRNDSLHQAILAYTGYLPTVYVRDEANQHDLELLQHRRQLSKEVTCTCNRIHALLAKNGVRAPAMNPRTEKGREFLNRIKDQLPGPTGSVLVSHLRLLVSKEHALQETQDLIEVRAAERSEVDLLMTIRGVTPLGALTILATIGSIDRFQTPGSLANYAGVVPKVRSSGTRRHHGKATKSGSKPLRWAATVAALQLIRQPGPHRNLYRRLKKKKGHGTAIVACARKLLVAIWHMLTNGEVFRETDSDLAERKQRARARQVAESRANVARKDDQHQVLLENLARLMELAPQGLPVPIPSRMKPSFGRAPVTAGADGLQA